LDVSAEKSETFRILSNVILNKCLAVADMADHLATMAENWSGLCPVWGRGSWVLIYHSVAGAEAYMHAKFHIDPSNRLVTIHQHYSQLVGCLVQR